MRIILVTSYLTCRSTESFSKSWNRICCVYSNKFTTIQLQIKFAKMNLVAVKPKFQVTIPAKLRKSVNFQEGDIMEAICVDDGILFKVKQVVDRKVVADRIASMLADVKIPPEDIRRSEEEIMDDIIAEISASRRGRRNNER